MALRDARAAIHAAMLAGGELQVYDGSMPNGGAAVTTQNLLVSFALPDPAGTVVEGVFSLGAIAEVLASGTGTASWVRILDAAGVWLMDLDAGPAGSGTAVAFTPAQIYAGGTVRFVGFSLIEP
jgi:hypothetical protein